MAIYHLSVRVGSRAGGQSATAKAMYNQRQGDYAHRRLELVHSASGNMPAWAGKPLQYWQAADANERANGNLFREVEAALPHELPLPTACALAEQFAKDLCGPQGLPWELAVHNKAGNWHFHLLMSERMHDGHDRSADTWFRRAAVRGKDPASGGAKKADLGQSRAWLTTTREAWAVACNRALELHGHEARIDHRSLADQGVDRLPQIHLGPHIGAMEARGIRTERGALALEIAETNQRIEALEQELRHGHDLGSDQGREVSRPGGPGAGAPVPGPGLDSGRFSGLDVEGVGAGPGPGPELGPGAGLGGGRVAGGPEADRPDLDRSGQGPEGLRAGGPRSGGGVAGGPGVRVEADGLHGIGGGTDWSGPADRIRVMAASRPSVDAADQPRRGPGGRDAEGGRMGAWDKTRTQVERQLKGMGAELFDVGVERPDKGMLPDLNNLTAKEVLAMVDQLKAYNARGENIYIRPSVREREALVMVDDLTPATVERLKVDGLAPAVIVESSPGNVQAWIRLKDRGEKLERSERSQLGRVLASTYGGDPAAIDFARFGRLAGFTNRKPHHVGGTGLFPFARLVSYNGKTAEKAPDVLSKAKVEHWAHRDRSMAQDVQAFARDFVTPDLAHWYREGWAMLQTKYQADLDRSRADWMLVLAMAERKGADLGKIAAVVAQNSPGLADRKHNVPDYLVRTVGKAAAWLEAKAGGEKWEEVRDTLLERAQPYMSQIMDGVDRAEKALAQERAQVSQRSYGMER